MASIKLSDGREIAVDLNKISIREFRAFVDPKQPDEEEYATIEKVTGLKSGEAGSLGYEDHRRIMKAIRDAINRPLDDPNP